MLVAVGTPLLALLLALATLSLLVWAVIKQRWPLTGWLGAAAIALPLALYAAVRSGCNTRESDLLCQYYGLFGAEAASAIALAIGWGIARSNMPMRL